MGKDTRAKKVTRYTIYLLGSGAVVTGITFAGILDPTILIAGGIAIAIILLGLIVWVTIEWAWDKD